MKPMTTLMILSWVILELGYIMTMLNQQIDKSFYALSIFAWIGMIYLKIREDIRGKKNG